MSEYPKPQPIADVPADIDEVLAWCPPYRRVDNGQVMPGTWVKAYRAYSGWITYHREGEESASDATHYLPLPPPVNGDE